MISNSYTITTTPVKLLSPSNSWRTVYIHVEANETVYFGGSGVTSSNGLPTEKHTAPIAFHIPAEEELWAVTAAGEAIMYMMKPALYAD